MRKLILLAALGLAACDLPDPIGLPNDVVPSTEEPFHAAAPWWGPSYETLPEHGALKNYWPNDSTLWVMDAQPELGIGTHFHKWEQLDLNRQQIRDLGMRLTRYTLYWSWAEQARQADGTYLRRPHTWFGNFAMNIEKGMAEGLEYVVVVHGMPKLPKDIWNGTTWADQDYINRRFADFLGEMAREFPEIRFWEIWNEADVGHWGVPFGRWNGTGFPRYEQGLNYGKTLKMAAAQIRAANPDAWIISNSVTGHESFKRNPANPGEFVIDHDKRSWDFLRGMYDAAGKESFDFLSTHSYSDQAEHMSALRGALASVGDRERPVWLTEFGASALDYELKHGGIPAQFGLENGPTYDQYQIDYWAQTLNFAQSTGEYDVVMGYQLFASDGIPDSSAVLPKGMTPFDYTYGMVRGDGETRRPIFNYLQSRDFNAPIRNRWKSKGDVRVTVGEREPIGVSFTRDGRDVILHDVTVDALTPTVIRFRKDCLAWVAAATKTERSCRPKS